MRRTNVYEKLLPLGSVVLLEGGTKRVMICGRVQARKGDDKVYDYTGCPYPEGIAGAGKMLFFDHDAIEHLFFVGFQDEEELAFRLRALAQLGRLYVDEEGLIREEE